MLRSRPPFPACGPRAASSDSSGSFECPLEIDPIASKWQELDSMDQHSPGFLPLFSLLLKGAGYRSTTKLRDGNAGIALDALDEVGHPLVMPGES